MRAKILLYLIILLAVFAFTLGPAAAEEFAGEFYDVSSHWGGEVIAQCRAYQLMNGYPENLFMPDQNLTRAEALVVIGRSLGWQAAAAPTSGIKFPADLWVNFRGYVALAAGKQLISKDDVPLIKFNEPAPRIEVAAWLAKALNLSGNGARLTFSDLKDVPVSLRNALAGVVGAGILQGLPGNLIAPAKPLTRTEMAAILVKLIDGGKVTPASGRQVAGKLKTVSLTQKKITIETAYGANIYDLDSSYLVFRNGRKSQQGDLAAGEDVKISLNKSGKCILIAYGGESSLPGQDTRTYSGMVVSLSEGFLFFKPDTGSALGLSVSPSAVVTLSGAGSSLSSVGAGARGTITVVGGIVARIDISGGTSPSSSGERGYVVNKYADYCTVRLSHGSLLDIWYANVLFTRNGAGVTYSALKRGSRVELERNDSAVTAVRILDDPRKLYGEVKQVNTSFITIIDEDDRETTLNIDGGVRILDRDGDRADLEDVETGYFVEITLDDSDNATEIRMSIDSANALEGIVEEISTTGNKRITIEDDKGESHTYYLASGVSVREGGASRSIDDVRTDMRVELTLGSSDEVSLIDIIGSYSVDGEVTDIRTSGTKRIKIEKSNGSEATYYLASGVIVRDGSVNGHLEDVAEGKNVRLTLDKDNKVTKIEITSESTVEGEVTFISTAGVDIIKIEKSSGSEKTYYLDDDVAVKEDGRSRDLEDVREGMYVRLTLNSRGDVTRIDLMWTSSSSDVEGEVTHIQTTGSNRFIEIEEGGGERTYDLAGSVTVWEGSASRSLNYILVGMKVELSLNSGGDVYRINVSSSSSDSFTVEGQVVDVWTSGTKRIAIRKYDGRKVTYYLDNYVLVKESGSSRDLDDINAGMDVKLTLDNTEVTRIDIYGSSYVEGVVTYVRTSDTERIVIEKTNGIEESYYIDDDVSVKENNHTRDLEDVDEGMKVRLNLDSDDRVVRIQIISVDYIQGEVTYIRTTGTKRIEIKKSNGREEGFYLNDGVLVREGNSTRHLDDVRTGMDVQLNLDSDSQVTRIDIL